MALSGRSAALVAAFALLLVVFAGFVLIRGFTGGMEAGVEEPVMEEAGEAPAVEEAEEPVVGSSVGYLAPDFTLETIDGEEISLSDFRGKTVILWFMIPAGCPICVSQAKELRAVSEEFGGDVVVIAVTLLDYEGVVEDLKSFRDERGSPEWFFAVDTVGLGVKYNIVEMGVIVIGPDGRIEFRGIPSASYEELAEVIAGLQKGGA